MRVRHLRGIIASVAVVAAYSAAGAEINSQGYDVIPVSMNPGTAEEISAGRKVYDQSCVQCHGVDGDGQGTMANLVTPRPRDFTTAVYKIRRTFAGETPTDQDLYDAIAKGLPGTSMPAWEGLLTDAEIRQVAFYIKSFSSDFQEYPAEEQLVVGEPLPATAESLTRGAQVYEEMQCAKCHGTTGRGNGPSAFELETDWGEKIWPADLTSGWIFRGGNTVSDIYRTLVTGFAGTPMPSYAPSMVSDDAWHLSNYVASLGRERVREVVIRAARVATIPTDPLAPEWAAAPMVDFEMAGQIIQAPRLFTPIGTNISVRALFDGEDVAIWTMWSDRADNHDGDGPPDQIAVQFAAKPLSGKEKPYFLMGDHANPVDYWQWTSGTNSVTNLLARGTGNVEVRESTIRANARYDDGRHHVIFRRTIKTEGEFDVQFEPGSFTPIAFNLWDGDNGEEGNQKTISAWFYLLLEPETPRTVYTWPVIAIFLGLGAEVAVVRRLKRARSKAN